MRMALFAQVLDVAERDGLGSPTKYDHAQPVIWYSAKRTPKTS